MRDHAPDSLVLRAGSSPLIARLPHFAAFAAFAVLLALALSGCEKPVEDRQRAAALQQTQAAIGAYSQASQAANSLHSEVIGAFVKANQSPSLPDYRDAMKRDVLPAMDRFIERLQAMPAGTPDLEQIHGGLLSAYKDARSELAAYADSLETAKDLARFGPIRERLQQRVAAYRSDLDAYYRRHNRQLRLEAGAAGAPGAATPTAP